jgi:hypothetical protein
MADIVAIGYPEDLIIQPDAIAVIVRDKDGSYHVRTTHHLAGTSALFLMLEKVTPGQSPALRPQGHYPP